MNRHFLLLPHLKIHNANAMSSPFTIGFPAMTAWLGVMHALERKVHENGFEQIHFSKLAISCHNFDLQTYKGRGDYVYSIIGTANPLDKDGSRPAFIEEARCHLEVSLLIEVEGYSIRVRDSLLSLINTLLMQMKVASGDLLNTHLAEILLLNEEDEGDQLKQILHRLMLGSVLIERRDLMIDSMKEGKDGVDALLDYLTVHHRPISTGDSDKLAWESRRKSPGWIIPIAVGYQGVSPLSDKPILNQRDDETPHQFAESIITLGEFKMPYRVEEIDEILWKYQFDDNKGLYLCCNQS